MESYDEENNQTIIKEIFDSCIKEVSSDEYNIIKEINKLRENPSNYNKKLVELAKNYKKMNGKDDIANKLTDVSKRLKDFSSCDKLEISSGLCFTSDYILKEQVKKNVNLSLKNMINVSVLVKKYCKSSGKINQLCELDLLDIVPRLLVSEFSKKDPIEILLDPNNKFVGLSSIEVDGSTRVYIIFSNSIEDFPSSTWEEEIVEVKKTKKEKEIVAENVEDHEVSGEEQDLMDRINDLRTNPNKQQKKLKSYCNKLRKDGRNEDADKLENSILKELNSLNPLNSFEMSTGLVFSSSSILKSLIKEDQFEMASKELISKVFETYLEEVKGKYQLLYHEGDLPNAEFSLLISNFDSNLNYKEQLLSNEYNFFGLSSLPFKNTRYTLIVVAESVKEFSFEEQGEEEEIVETTITKKKKVIDFKVNEGDENKGIEMLELIQRYRSNPIELEDHFKSYLKHVEAYDNNNNKTEKDKINSLIKNLKNLTKLDKFTVSESLCKSAKYISENNKNLKSYSKNELLGIVNKFGINKENVCYLITDGNTEHILPKGLLLNDFDNTSIAFRNSTYKYLGYASHDYDDGEVRSTIILAENIIESNQIDIKTNEVENSIMNLINRFRMDPTTFEKEFSVISKFLNRMPNKKSQSEELKNLSSKLKLRPKTDKLKISIGLTKVAQILLSGVKDLEKDFKCLNKEEFKNICSLYTKSFKEIFQIIDLGETDQIISRFMISDYDLERTYRINLENVKYNYAGIASKEMEDSVLSIVILGEDIEELDEYVESNKVANENLLNIEKEFNKKFYKSMESNVVSNDIKELIEESINKIRQNPKDYIDLFNNKGSALENEYGKKLENTSLFLNDQTSHEKLIISDKLNQICNENDNVSK
jgi:hypothetical protein